MDIWGKYFDKTKNKPPRPLLVEALGYVNERGQALDLGAGALNDSAYLVEQGFNVTALDKKSVAEFFNVEVPEEKFQYVIEPFETFEFPDRKFDLVNAQFSLPFIRPENFPKVFASIKNSLRNNGIFVGQLFGNRDSWSSNPSRTFHSKKEARDLFEDFEILKFIEEERDGQTAIGEDKHWHIFHFIARK